MDLFLISDFEKVDNTLKFTAECDNEKEYNVFIDLDDIASYIGCEAIDTFEDKQTLNQVCQDIIHEHTANGTYNVIVEQIKKKYYRFAKQVGRTVEQFEAPFSSFVDHAAMLAFKKQHNFKTHSIVLL